MVHGVTVRWSDGIHVTAAGGEYLQPHILPVIDRLGLLAEPAVARAETKEQKSTRAGSRQVAPPAP